MNAPSISLAPDAAGPAVPGWAWAVVLLLAALALSASRTGGRALAESLRGPDSSAEARSVEEAPRMPHVALDPTRLCR